MTVPPQIHIREGSSSGELVTLNRELWGEVMHQLDPDTFLFTKLLALGLPHWDVDLEDMPVFAVALDAALADAEPVAAR